MSDALPLLHATQKSCTCRVCLDVLKDPVAFHCGHVLCRSCAERCITARPRCPLCNRSVPNTRHIVPLPQLSFFCIAVREVGLRVQRLRPPSLVAESNAWGADQHVKRCRTEVSPPLQPSPSDTPIRVAQPLSDLLLLRGALHDTQRLDSESAENTPPPPPSTVPPAIVNSTSELGLDGALSPHAATCKGAATTSAALEGERERTSPTTPTLALLLQAHFAEEVEQLDSTPRLDLPEREEEQEERKATVPLSNRLVPLSSPSATELEGETSSSSSLWRLWRRGKGVVHCSLRPPALRLEDAAHSQHHAQEASTHDGEKDKANASSSLSSRGRVRRVASSATPSSLTPSEVTRLHRSGTCLLCGLNVVHRTAVRHHLQRLLRSPLAQCDPAELSAQTEDSLALLLGPLWEVVCACDASAPVTGCDGVYCVGAEAAEREFAMPHALRGVAHHNCLCWAGLLDKFTDTSSTAVSPDDAAAAVTSKAVLRMSVPMVDPVRLCAAHTSGRVARWQLLAATLWRLHRLASTDVNTETNRKGVVEATDASGDQRQQHGATGPTTPASPAPAPRCALCAASATSMAALPPDIFGVGLRSCEGVERGESSCGRYYHYPCALLAGASACLVFGLDDDANVLSRPHDVCVRGTPTETTTTVAASAAPPVEVWCGTCHERHVIRRRSRAL